MGLRGGSGVSCLHESILAAGRPRRAWCQCAVQGLNPA
ncbi:hypothetical protein A33M_4273 [Rhodovulum sp. PH10]|nr:hypothetical protein A33M_4273 [Rhodovulum sp. PH10]